MTAQPNRPLADVAHHCLAHWPESGQCQQARDGHAAIERVHDLAAFACSDEEGTDDGGHDRYRTEYQRVEDVAEVEAAISALEQQSTQHHRCDHGDSVGFEKIGGHAGAVTDVVTDVVGDDGRIAGVVFRDAGFDLADQVSADVGALGENAAAEAREDRDQRATKGQTDQRVQRCIVTDEATHHAEVTGDAQQSQSNHEHARDRAAPKGDLQCLIQAVASRVRGTHVGAHRDVHADEARSTRQHCADHKATGSGGTKHQREDDGQYHADDCDRDVLPVEVSLRTGLDGCCDLLHAGIAG